MTVCEWCGGVHPRAALCRGRRWVTRRGFVSVLTAGLVGLALPRLPVLTEIALEHLAPEAGRRSAIYDLTADLALWKGLTGVWIPAEAEAVRVTDELPARPRLLRRDAAGVALPVRGSGKRRTPSAPNWGVRADVD